MTTREWRRRGCRNLDLTFDGKPIYEPTANASGLIDAPMGGGKTTCGAMPAIRSLVADRPQALFIKDVKEGEIADLVSKLCRKRRRKFVVVDPFGVLSAEPTVEKSSALGTRRAPIDAGMIDDDA